MDTTIPKNRGNAVTLTLLGLAVAILAGVAVLYFVGRDAPAPVPVAQLHEEVTYTDDEEENPREGWGLYENMTYNFALEYPSGWIVATGTILGAPVITVYDASQPRTASSTFGVHEARTRVSVYPQGLALPLEADLLVDSKVIVPAPEATSKDMLLGRSTRPWATVTYFGRYPDAWTREGFVFVRTNVDEEEVSYMRDSEEIEEEEYSEDEGDYTVRYGFVDTSVRDVQEEILRSFHFLTTEGAEMNEETPEDAILRVTNPTQNMVVSSPLLVQGEAQGPWYFEGSFPVVLEDVSGKRLAEVPATALDDWMVEEYVPFEVSLVFASTTATSGVLRLMRANPSGIEENDASYEIPVQF